MSRIAVYALFAYAIIYFCRGKMNLLNTPLYIKMIYQYVMSFSGSKNAVFYSDAETVNKIVDGHLSFLRIGDGEFDIMEGKSIHYQRFDPALASGLRLVINEACENNNVPYLIGMPGYYLQGRASIKLRSRVDISSWSHARYHFNMWFDKNVCYGDSHLFAKSNKTKYEKIWNDSSITNVVFVHNDKKYADQFSKTYKIATDFVKIPSKDAYSQVNVIFEQIEKKADIGHSMILISAGPCGKILTYRLAKKGYWAIDTGHCWDDPLTL